MSNSSKTKINKEELFAAGLAVTGKTFNVKEDLKEVGCVWYPTEKVWLAKNEEIHAAAKQIVAAQTAQSTARKVERSEKAPASDRQKRYLMTLIGRAHAQDAWFNILDGAGRPPSDADVENMDADEVSYWIDTING